MTPEYLAYKRKSCGRSNDTFSWKTQYPTDPDSKACKDKKK